MATLPREVADAIEAFIRREFRIAASGIPFSRDEHLFEGGFVDSAGVVELILFIESTFNVKLGDEQVFSEQFTSINGIAEIVMGCRRTDGVSATVR
jgi:acyl carrier protein